MELLTKCYSCGGEILFPEGKDTVQCEYCSRTNARPKSEKNELDRMKYANERLSFGEFDEAEEGYRKVLQHTPDEHEARWGLLLCKYGVQYVEDNKTGKRLPTCRRALPTSFCAEPDFRLACAAAPRAVREEYERDGRYIDDIQREIRRLKSTGEKYDIFVCYKETDESGKRTRDSVLAQNLYQTLTLHGFNVFYAPISLKKRLGANYEASIYCAVESSQIMLVLATKPEYLHTTWVKSEWKRYLDRIDRGEEKLLIPLYRDFTPDCLPSEFADRFLQGLDMAPFSFLSDLEAFLSPILKEPEQEEPEEDETSERLDKLLRRGFMDLEDGDFEAAKECFDEALDEDPESARANLGMAMAELQARNEDELTQICAKREDWSKLKHMRRFRKFAGEEGRELLDRIARAAKAEQARAAEEYRAAEEARREAERRAAEESARREAERRVAEEKLRREAELKKRQEEAQRKAAEQARAEAERKAAEEARREAERKAAEDALRVAENRAAEAKLQREAELRRQLEEAQLEAEKQARAEAKQRRILLARLVSVIGGVKEKRQALEQRLEELKKIAAQVEKARQPETGRTPAMDTTAKKLQQIAEVKRDYDYIHAAAGFIITRYKGTQADVVVPPMMIGLPVVGIYEGAFSKNSAIRTVKLPDSVSEIGAEAFSDCVNLTSVTLPKGLVSIKPKTFYGCTALTGVSIPDSVREIGSKAFMRCSSLKDIVIPYGVAAVRESTFAHCEKLETVFLPGSLESIGWYAFTNCNALREISIPDRVTVLGMWAFADCASLRGVRLPDKLMKIDTGVFADCPMLVNINIPDSVKAIEDEAFRGCRSLRSLSVKRSTNVKYQGSNSPKIKKPWF